VEITDAGLDPACSSFDAMYAIGPVATPNVHRSNATGAAVVAPGWLVKNANTSRHQIHKAALVYRSPSTRNGHASTGRFSINIAPGAARRPPGRRMIPSRKCEKNSPATPQPIAHH